MTHVERDKTIREFVGDENRELDHDAMIEMALIKLIQADEETLDFEPDKEADVHPAKKKPKKGKK